MTDQAQPIPASVQSAFRLYVAVVAVSVVNVVLLVAFHVAPALVLLNPVVEAGLFLGVGVQMRLGRQWARGLLLGLSGLFLAVNLNGLLSVYRGFEHAPTAVTVLLMCLVLLKIVLLVLAVTRMYRAADYAYFR